MSSFGVPEAGCAVKSTLVMLVAVNSEAAGAAHWSTASKTNRRGGGFIRILGFGVESLGDAPGAAGGRGKRGRLRCTLERRVEEDEHRGVEKLRPRRVVIASEGDQVAVAGVRGCKRG